MLVLDFYNYQEFFVKYCVQYTAERFVTKVLLYHDLQNCFESVDFFSKCSKTNHKNIK